MRYISTDFGARNSVICVQTGIYQEGNNIVEHELFSSYIAYDDNGNVIGIGKDAENLAEERPTHVIYDIKRLIGRRFDEPEVQRYRSFLAYDIDQDTEGNLVIKIGNKSLYPEDVVSDFFEKMLEKTLLKFPALVIGQWVVTVPVYFDVIKCLKMKKAAFLAIKKLKKEPFFHDRVRIPDNCTIQPIDVKEIHLVFEPAAAFLTYLAKPHLEIPEDKYVMVFDLGTYNLDIAFGKIAKDVNPLTLEPIYNIRITIVHGNNNLGGFDMDKKIYSEIESNLHNKEYELTNEVRHKLIKEVELAKIRLLNLPETNIILNEKNIRINISSIFTQHGRYDPESIILEKCIEDILNAIRTEIRQTKTMAGIDRCQIGTVILVGGPSIMPSVRKAVEIETIPIEYIPGWDPLTCVAEGSIRLIR